MSPPALAQSGSVVAPASALVVVDTVDMVVVQTGCIAEVIGSSRRICARDDPDRDSDHMAEAEVGRVERNRTVLPTVLP